MIVIPAVDIRGGRCVRLQQGEADRETVYRDDPLAPAKEFADAGARRVHVVDLDGAFEGAPANLDLICRLIGAVDVEVEVGGGIRTAEAADRLIAAGAARVIVGTRGVEDPEFIAALTERFPGQINLGLDCRNGNVALRGWTQTTGLLVDEVLARVAELPLGEIVYTDISKDGMLAGPNLDETAGVIARSHHPIIASGGVSSVEDIARCADIGAFGAIVGKALYDGRMTLSAALAAQT